MKIFQVETFYAPFLDAAYRNPSLAQASYAEQVTHLLDSGFSAGHMVTPYLPALGHEAFTCIGNCVPLQKTWLRETLSEADLKKGYTLKQVMAMQIEAFQPDILYASDPTFLDSSLIATLTHKPKLCVAWRAAPTASTVDLSGFDLTLTSDPSFRAICERLGARRIAYHFPGHPQWVNGHLGALETEYDIVFSGQVGGLHKKRVQALESILPALTAHGLRVGLFALGSFPNNPYLNGLNKGPRFGLDMYRVLRQARMTLNIVIDTASPNGINMRHFEAAGVGSLMVGCGARHNIVFEAGTECVCQERVGETIDQILMLMEKPRLLEWIAANGHRKCMAEYEMTIRTQRFLELCEAALKGGSHLM